MSSSLLVPSPRLFNNVSSNCNSLREQNRESFDRLVIHLVPDKRDETGKKGFYNPIVFPNEFWHLRQHYIPVNETTPSLPLQITFQPMSYMKFQIFSSMTASFDEAAKQQGGAGAELDEVKRMLIETNPWFLALTGIVSLLHVL